MSSITFSVINDTVFPSPHSYCQNSSDGKNLVDKYLVVVLDDHSSESMEIYESTILKIIRSCPSIKIERSNALIETYKKIVEEEISSFKDRKLTVLTLTDRAEVGISDVTPDWLIESIRSINGEFFAEICFKCKYFSKGAEKIETSVIESFSSSNTKQDLHIPVVNMSDFFSLDLECKANFTKTLHQAMTTVGFFAVQNVGIAQEVVTEAYRQSEMFFNNDIDNKMKSFIHDPDPRKGQRGYIPGEKAKGVAVGDFKEFWHIGSERSPLINVWPEEEGFKAAMTSMYRELEQYIVPLQQAITEAINLNAPDLDKLPIDFLNEKTANGENLLRVLHYPAVSQEQLEGPNPPCWGAAHTDIDILAILPYATAKGLQVKIGEEWLNAVVPKDAFVVNVGDMLQNLTNGLFKSSEHRIIAEIVGEDRFSIVMFGHPMGNATLDPLPICITQTGGIQSYAPGTRDEFLWERLLELGIAPGVLPLYAASGHLERQLKYNRASPQVLQLLLQNRMITETPEIRDILKLNGLTVA